MEISKKDLDLAKDLTDGLIDPVLLPAFLSWKEEVFSRGAGRKRAAFDEARHLLTFIGGASDRVERELSQEFLFLFFQAKEDFKNLAKNYRERYDSAFREAC